MDYAATDCRAILERLYLYLDGEIAGEECSVIQTHIERCVSCLEHYGFERDFKELVHRKCREGHAPEELLQRIRGQLRTVLGEPG